MSFFGKKPKSAQQKAQMAKTRIMLRGVALVFLIFYVILPMIDADVEDVESMHPMLRYGILAFFIIACIWLVIATVLEYVRNKKAGLYTADGYEDDEGIERFEEPEPEPSDENEDDDEDDDYDDEDDDDYDNEDDDEDYDDDDDDYDDEDDDIDEEKEEKE